jgi:hypothetical protein
MLQHVTLTYGLELFPGELCDKTLRTCAAREHRSAASSFVVHVGMSVLDECASTMESWSFLLSVDSVQKAVNHVRDGLEKGLPPHEIAAEMLDACLASSPSDSCGMGCDNMTAVIVLFKPTTADGR